MNHLALLISLLLIAPPGVSKPEPAPVKGIFCLMKSMAPMDPSVLRMPCIPGVSIRFTWEDVEPEEGKIDWDYLEHALGQVKRANKKAMVSVLPGIRSPAWIYKKGVRTLEFTDNNRYHKSYGRRLRMPLPWDETLIQEWIKFVVQLGKKVDPDDAVVLVHLAGPNTSSLEMHLPKGENAALVEEAGYSREKIVTAWKQVIDAYAKAFPHKDLALHIAVPLVKDGAMEEVIQYGISRVGSRFCIQGDFLNARTNGLFYPYRVMREYREKYGVTLGFQMADSAYYRPRREGPLETAIEKGLQAGAQYFEVFYADIIDPQNKELWERLYAKLR
jgi:hypothetical protein